MENETPKIYHLAEINIGRIVAPLEDLIMYGFVSKLDEINQLAEDSPGFVWRLKTDAGNATDFRPYEDERMIINMSVWDSVESLYNYVYRSDHTPYVGKRKQWFEPLTTPFNALWWVEAGHEPTIEEGKHRLELLTEHGPTPLAFTFKKLFQPADLPDYSGVPG